MRTIFAEYNPQRNSIDVYTSAGYMLRIDCWEAEKNLTTTPGSDCALNALAIDEPLEYARLYLDGTMQMEPTAFPFRNSTRVGMTLIPSAPANCGSSSILILPTARLSAYSTAIFSYAGPILRQ